MMKKIFIALTIVASFALIANAHAWLGDSEPALVQHYGKPQAVEVSTAGIPTQKGVYIELTETFTTNISLIASTNDDYNLNLVETRQRDTFLKDGEQISVYVGNIGERYNGVDFSGASVREVINCPITWQKNTHNDLIGRFAFFSPAAINTMLGNNRGDSTWPDSWRPLPYTPGIFIKRTADKSRIALAYGTSVKEIYRLEFRLIEQSSLTAD